MKKVIFLSLMLGAAVIALPGVDANAATTNSISEPQINVRIGQPRRRWNNRRGTRIVTRTRIVRIGFRTYRETYRIMYLPNGRTRTTVISRVRIR